MKNNKEKGFTLLEVLISIGILAFVMTSALKIFSTNSMAVQTFEKKTMAGFVAQNVLVKSFFEENLIYEEGSSRQGNREYQWKRTINILDDGNSLEIEIKVTDTENNTVYELLGFRVLQ